VTATALRARLVAAPLLFGALFLVLWQLVVTGFDLKPYVVPGPLSIWEQLTRNLGNIALASLLTARNALLGLAIGVVLGLVWASVASAVRVVREASAPVVLALSVVPIVALAPVLYTMFGASAQTARVMVAAIAVYVPIYLNTLRGLQTVAPIHRDLMQVYAASGWQTVRAVTLPGALPFFFTGLGIASSLSVISALVAEYFGGPVDGLGKAITSAVSSSQYALAWAYVVGAVLTGLAFFVVTSAIDRIGLRNHPASA
jgi:NitT/TauT family transport system permease protein